MKSMVINKKYTPSIDKDEKDKHFDSKEEETYHFPGVKIGVIMPAYNEEKNIGRTLSLFPKNISDNLDILVIDDGSHDRTCEIAKCHDVILIKHSRNRGNGAAIQTGLDFCRANEYEIALVIDADGQHDPNDIYKFIKPIVENGYDFVVGNRFQYFYDMSILKKLCSRMMSIFYTILLQKRITDPTMGYKALSSKIFTSIDFESNYSITQEMLLKIIPNFRFKEISTKIYEREYGESFIKLNKYFQKTIFSVLKFYLFPKFNKIFNKVLTKTKLKGKFSALIHT